MNPSETASQLFAIARGIPAPIGPHRCFYCNAVCADDFLSKEFVKGSFTGWAGVANPNSDFVCGGCVATMNESADIQIPNESRIGQRIRNYSWLITESSARAFTKAHIAEIRQHCLNPPQPPFVLVISDSGQKQLLYRAPVCLDVNSPIVMLEDEPIPYLIPALSQMLDLCGLLIAATGKPALREPVSFSFARAILTAYPATGEKMLEEWERVQSTPLARLATWLSASKEDQKEKYDSNNGL